MHCLYLLPFAAKLVSPKRNNKSKQTNNGFKEHLVLYRLLYKVYNAQCFKYTISDLKMVSNLKCF